ncbi:SusC/RagA family TonB-linked outer membrane protein [Hymenobacter amundsenii]|uniref:SusC/RagA family TonB-linked outer membrane protein n=1 Tax=Hymenobacter amundsenii TaxID=2006685 RepID=A0A246FFX7_9BACT|nr:TonB-dependent receptor [Hymenobacter amundsenii]OWP61430.1 SusC/RagA family TonB-linked outer membrane protein [Hymenobacter amundsenii]
MRKNYLLPLMGSLLVATTAVGQTRAVSGRVTDAGGSGLPGVTVLEKGTSNGTSTGTDGSFTLSVPAGATLVISSIGFETQSVLVGNRTNLPVTLRSNATELGEAVVVGYGSQSKADLTGSVVQLGSKEVANVALPSFEQAIQGKAAGVFIESGSGKLGQGIRVRVRGVSSISGDNQPLYVVDGIPVVSDNLSSTSAATNPISDINPNDIASISILKDAAASAIYGSRATNGVVLITTKRGQQGGTRFTVGYQTGRSEPTRKREFLNAEEYRTLLTEALQNFGSSAASIDARLTRYAAGQADYATNGVDTNWQNETFQKGRFSQYDISASGGNEKTKFFFSGQYSDNNGILVGNRYQRINTRFNLDNQATDRLKLGLNIGLSRSDNQRLPNDNAFSSPMQIVALAPITPFIDPRSGLLSGVLDPSTGQPNSTYPFYYNPLISVRNGNYLTTSYRVLGNAYAQFRLLPGLMFNSQLGTDIINQDENQFLGRVTARNTGPTNGFGFNAATTSARVVVNNFLAFDKVLNELHTLDFTLGTSYEATQIKSNSVTGSQFASDSYKTLVSAAQITAGATNQTENTLVSYFGRASYNYAGKYLAGLSARLDGSSRFGVNKRYGFFPAASAGWLISEESFLKDNAVLSMLKIRGSIGRTGNQGFANFASRALYSGTSGYVGIPGQRPLQLASPDLTWETTTQTDVGLEYGFLQGRISGEVDLYLKKTTGLALSQPVPGTSGFATLFKNVGNMENRGIELSLTTRNIEGPFNWTTSVNAARNRNRVTKLDGPPILGNFLNRAQEGQPLGVFVGPEYAGVDPANGNALYYLNTTDTNGNLNRSTTANSNEAELVPLGNPNPTWTGGLTNTFSFKGFDLTATLVGVFGNKVFDGGAQFYSTGFNNGPDNQTRDQLNRWQKPGDITNVPRAEYFGGNGIALSSQFVRNGSYGRLRTATLGYNIPVAVAQRAKLQSARVFVQGLNLLTFTDYKGWDPEVSTDYLAGNSNPTTGVTNTQGNINQGIDFYTAPQPRTYTIGVTLGF